MYLCHILQHAKNSENTRFLKKHVFIPNFDAPSPPPPTPPPCTVSFCCGSCFDCNCSRELCIYIYIYIHKLLETNTETLRKTKTLKVMRKKNTFLIFYLLYNFTHISNSFLFFCSLLPVRFAQCFGLYHHLRCALKQAKKTPF